MTRLHLYLTAIMLILIAGQTSWGRGFGGFHGMPHVGGMPHMGGAPHMGGVPRPGGFQPGGMNFGARPGGMNLEGVRPGGSTGGMRPGGFSPTGGLGNLGNRVPNFGGPGLGASRSGPAGGFVAGRPRTAGFGQRSFPGGAKKQSSGCWCGSRRMRTQHNNRKKVFRETKTT
jgi:hypothetical protein